MKKIIKQTIKEVIHPSPKRERRGKMKKAVNKVMSYSWVTLLLYSANYPKVKFSQKIYGRSFYYGTGFLG